MLILLLNTCFHYCIKTYPQIPGIQRYETTREAGKHNEFIEVSSFIKQCIRTNTTAAHIVLQLFYHSIDTERKHCSQVGSLGRSYFCVVRADNAVLCRRLIEDGETIVHEVRDGDGCAMFYIMQPVEVA